LLLIVFVCRCECHYIKPLIEEIIDELVKTNFEGVMPIKNCVTFILAILTYDIKSTGQPVYLSDYEPVHTVRASSKRLLTFNDAGTVLTKHGFNSDILRF